MIGAIIGDMVGSPYEGGYRRSVTTPEFNPLFSPDSRFTDDSVLTCATAQAITTPSILPYPRRFAQQYKQWGLRYPDRGYGSKFKEWMAYPKFTVNQLCQWVHDALQSYCHALPRPRNSIEAGGTKSLSNSPFARVISWGSVYC